jgi:hypothetical protein
MSRSTTTTAAGAVCAAAWLAWRHRAVGQELAQERSARLMERIGAQEQLLHAQARAAREEQQRLLWKRSVVERLTDLTSDQAVVEEAQRIVDAAWAAIITKEG